MNLVNEEITHKTFGEGSIVEQDESIVTVDFKDDTKKFVYPDAFGKFIMLKDKDTAKSLHKAIAKAEKRQEKLDKEREEEKERRALEQERRKQVKNGKIHDSSQIVFWLDEAEQQSVFDDWQISNGKVQSGENKGQPNRLARLRPNSAVLLTVRESDEPETERRIIGLYMAEETFAGNHDDVGAVPAHGEYRIELSGDESVKMLFWNYYINKNYPHRMTWNSGRSRYFDNIWTAQILKDIIALKEDESGIKRAESFLEYFCKMNALHTDDIPEANGALKQNDER